VEDEITIRENIRNSIDWKSSDFTYIGDAGDGEEALIKIAQLNPDIVITDIKMPNMDGLNLCKYIRRANPNVYIAIISGFNDFEFARQAIELQVSEYLLKPITPIKLMKALTKAAMKLDEKRESSTTIELLKRELEASNAFTRDKHLINLLTNIGLSNEESKAAKYVLDLKGEFFSVIVVRCSKNINQLNFEQTIHNCAKSAVVFRFGYLELGVIVQGATVEATNQIIENLRCRLLQIGEFGVLNLSAGQIVSDVSQLGISLQSAYKSIETNMTRKPVGMDGFSKVSPSNIIDSEALEHFLATGRMSEADSFADAIYEDVSGDISPMFSSYALAQLIFTVKKFASHYRLGNALDTETWSTENVSGGLEAKARFQQILRSVLRARDAIHSSNHTGIVSSVKRAIDQQYASKELSLKTLAKNVNISSAYLSTLFKQNYGKTISDYIIEVRLNKAKELLRSSAMKTTEVSEAVGYTDPNYFSTFFKKYTGMTPREYKNTK
jgi:two-component system response regulator YesN